MKNLLFLSSILFLALSQTKQAMAENNAQAIKVQAKSNYQNLVSQKSVKYGPEDGLERIKVAATENSVGRVLSTVQPQKQKSQTPIPILHQKQTKLSPAPLVQSQPTPSESIITKQKQPTPAVSVIPKHSITVIPASQPIIINTPSKKSLKKKSTLSSSKQQLLPSPTSAPKTNLIKGVTNSVTGQYNLVDGEKNRVNGNSNTALGNKNIIEGSKNAVVGHNSLVRGSENIVISSPVLLF